MKETVKEGAEEAKPIVDDAAKETKSAANELKHEANKKRLM